MGERKKIFLLVPSLAIGGQERIAVETAKCLLDEYDTEIIVFHRHCNEYESPCPVRCLESSSHKNFFERVTAQGKRIVRLSRIRKSEKPAVVYSFGATANLTNVLSSWFSPGKTIVAIHGFASVSKNILNTIIFRRANLVICISKAMKYKLDQLFPDLKNVAVVENGYDVEAIESVECPPCDKKGTVCFAAMGRFSKVKGYDRLIKAFSIVSKEIENVKLTFIGDGELREELLSLTVKENVEDKVVFLGYKKDPFSYLKKADIFVLSSHSEGFPNSLIEALGCGLGIVSVDCQSGPGEILLSGWKDERIKGVRPCDYGILTENSAKEDELIEYLAEGMIFLAKDPTLLATYKAKAKNRAYEYSLTVYEAKIKALLIELI